MSIKVSLARTAIKLTPMKLVAWVANIVLKDIAKIKQLDFDLDARDSYVQVQLEGEAETIEVWLEDFGIINEAGSYRLMIKAARSNRVWLNNILSRIIKKEWDIPVPSHFASHFEFVAELFKAKDQDDPEAS